MARVFFRPEIPRGVINGLLSHPAHDDLVMKIPKIVYIIEY